MKKLSGIKDITGLKQDIKMMYLMEPLEVCEIVDNPYAGEIVMRTASTDKFEVISLSRPGHGRCWTGNPALKVKEVKCSEITLSLSDESINY